MHTDSKIYIPGHTGLAGSAILRKLKSLGYENILTRSHAELDLTRQADTESFFKDTRPDYVFMAAAKVGGIMTNEAYAVAKIAGIKMCQSFNHQYHTRFMAVMPTNLYGPNDNYDPVTSHALAALIRKFHQAKVTNSPEVIVWGTGTPRREFLHSDDLADACVFIMNLDEDRFTSLLHDHEAPLVNIGVGQDISISELAEIMKTTIGFTGRIVYDTTKSDGTFQKLLDVSRMSSLGWQAKISLTDGVRSTYDRCLQNNEFEKQQDQAPKT